MHLSQINLNLLVALEALLSERHVTRAGKKVFLSQSAMSCVLNQLRDLFQDELLVRQGKQMVLTPCAQELVSEVQEILKKIEQIVDGCQAFDPKISKRVFTIAMTEYSDSILLPYLYPYLNKHAPGIKLIVKSLFPIEYKKAFEANELDLGIGLAYEIPRVESAILFQEPMVCIARANHPLFKKRLTTKAYSNALHVGFSMEPPNYGVMAADRLAQKGITRNYGLFVSHVFPALHALVNSDLIATVPEGMARTASKWFKLAIQALPFSHEEITYVQMWHRRFNNDQSHQWLRCVVQKLTQKNVPDKSISGYSVF